MQGLGLKGCEGSSVVFSSSNMLIGSIENTCVPCKFILELWLDLAAWCLDLTNKFKCWCIPCLNSKIMQLPWILSCRQTFVVKCFENMINPWSVFNLMQQLFSFKKWRNVIIASANGRSFAARQGGTIDSFESWHENAILSWLGWLASFCPEAVWPSSF